MKTMDGLQKLSADFAATYRESLARIEAQRLTLALSSKSTRPLDTGLRPISESPLFAVGQKGLFDQEGE